jgi:hypothetical protein
MKSLFNILTVLMLGLALTVPAAAQQDRGSRGRGKKPSDIVVEPKGDGARPRNDNGGNRDRGQGGEARGRDGRDGRDDRRGEGRRNRPNDDF